MEPDIDGLTPEHDANSTTTSYFNMTDGNPVMIALAGYCTKGVVFGINIDV